MNPSLVFAEQDEVDAVIEGAVIERFEMQDDGARIFLEDGRTVLIPGATAFLICFTKGIIH